MSLKVKLGTVVFSQVEQLPVLDCILNGTGLWERTEDTPHGQIIKVWAFSTLIIPDIKPVHVKVAF